MIETDEDRADALFHALADRTRRDILRRVLAGEHSVSTLAKHYEMSFAAVQKHVAVLERAGLLTKRRQGREALASGDVQVVRAANQLLSELESVWRGRIARIDALLVENSQHDNAHSQGADSRPSIPPPVPRHQHKPTPVDRSEE
ncbi:MAG TPA: metalloregulator ArsR/SmtB family transcription factor [Micropruina sp.]|nr:metalloregulator ArsR/SmtB family transcription factor [Micropruina sp.]